MIIYAANYALEDRIKKGPINLNAYVFATHVYLEDNKPSESDALGACILPMFEMKR